MTPTPAKRRSPIPARSPFVILLAAGASRRFGSPKALALLDGEPLLARALRTVRSFAGDRYLVVLGHHHAEILNAVPIETPHRVVVSISTGLSGSIRAALTALPDDAECALLMLADQPALRPCDLDLLTRAWKSAPERAAAALHANAPGAPCILPRGLFQAAMQLRGDRGAQALLREQRQLTTIDLPAAAIDVDTPDDLERYRLIARDLIARDLIGRDERC